MLSLSSHSHQEESLTNTLVYVFISNKKTREYGRFIEEWTRSIHDIVRGNVLQRNYCFHVRFTSIYVIPAFSCDDKVMFAFFFADNYSQSGYVPEVVSCKLYLLFIPSYFLLEWINQQKRRSRSWKICGKRYERNRNLIIDHIGSVIF